MANGKRKINAMTEFILTISILQLLIPLLLLFRQWQERSPSKIQWLFKTILAIGYLTAIAVAGLWNLLPFFVPYLFLVASLLFAARGFLRIRQAPFWRAETVSEKIKVGATALFAVLVSALTIYAMSGWSIAQGYAVQLHFPLRDGVFYIANGGSNSLLNAHLETLEGERFHPYRGQSFGVDILQINRFGLRANGFLPANPEEYVIFGAPVYSPCAGTVIETENGREDQPVPEIDESVRPGNHVILDCGEFVILLAHFKKGSVAVAAGQQVEAGEKLGEVGNTGETGEPHLHIHAQRRGSQPTALDGEPLWILFEGNKFFVRNRIIVR